jgi:hypothetical protein
VEERRFSAAKLPKKKRGFSPGFWVAQRFSAAFKEQEDMRL